jgi:hypothetical protein
VHALEPAQSPWAKATFERAGVPSLRVHAALAGAKRGRASLGVSSVEMIAVDELVKGPVALIRVGMAGLEREALAGARRALASGALVWLDRQGAPLGPIEAELRRYELSAMGWAPGLGALVPIDATSSRSAVFGVSTAARARLGARIVIVKRDAPLPAEPDAPAPWAALAHGPRESDPAHPALVALQWAHDERLPVDVRWGQLRRALKEAESWSRREPNAPAPRLVLARTLFAIGEVGRAGLVLEPMMGAIDAPMFETISTPFVGPLARFDALDRSDGSAWLRAQLIEAFIKSSAPSSFFHGAEFLSLFARFDTLGFPDPEMDRRECLLRTRFERPEPLSGSDRDSTRR